MMSEWLYEMVAVEKCDCADRLHLQYPDTFAFFRYFRFGEVVRLVRRRVRPTSRFTIFSK